MPFSMNDFTLGWPEHVRKINKSWDEVHKEQEERWQKAMGIMFKLDDGTAISYQDSMWNYYDKDKQVWTWAHGYLIEQAKAKLKELGMSGIIQEQGEWKDQCPGCGKVFSLKENVALHACVIKPPRPKRKELKAKIAELEKELEFVRDPKFVEINANSDKRVRDLSDHINQIVRENTELKNKLELTGRFHDAAVQRNKELQAQLDQAKKDAVEQHTKLYDAVNSREKAETDVKDLEREFLEFRGKTEKATKDLSDDYLDKINEWRSCIQKIAELQEAYDTYEHLSKTKQATIDMLDKKLEGLKVELDRYRLEGFEDSVHFTISQKDEQISRLEGTIDSYIRKCNHLLAQRDAEIAKVVELESTVKYWVDKYESTSKALDALGYKLENGKIVNEFKLM